MSNFVRIVSFVVLVNLLLSLNSGESVSAQSQAGITSPAPGSAVSGPVPIMGTAVIEPFQRYELYFKQEPNGDESYIYFGGATQQIVGGQLGVWQTGDLAPGTYTVRMRVVKTDGNYSEHFIPNLTVGVNVPSPTPTASPTPSEPTPTPIPINTPTPLPQPTPEVVSVEQPELDSPTATPTPELVALGSDDSPGEPQAVAEERAVVPESDPLGDVSSFAGELGEAVAIDRLRDRFFTGVRWSAAAFLLVFALYAAKRMFVWVFSRIG